jgi:hypothetical protein
MNQAAKDLMMPDDIGAFGPAGVASGRSTWTMSASDRMFDKGVCEVVAHFGPNMDDEAMVELVDELAKNIRSYRDQARRG